MDLSLIPVAIILTLIMFDGSLDPNYTENRARQEQQSAISQGIESDNVIKDYDVSTVNKDSEFRTIYNYIKNVYKKISEQDARKITQNIVDYADKYKVDPKLTAALMARESAFNKEAVSSTGAKGLGQIKDFNYESLDIQNPFDIKDNVQGTTRYLKEMVSKFKTKSNKVAYGLASYYQGFTATKKSKDNLNQGTKTYISDILKKYKQIESFKDK